MNKKGALSFFPRSYCQIFCLHNERKSERRGRGMARHASLHVACGSHATAAERYSARSLRRSNYWLYSTLRRRDEFPCIAGMSRHGPRSCGKKVYYFIVI